MFKKFQVADAKYDRNIKKVLLIKQDFFENLAIYILKFIKKLL